MTWLRWLEYRVWGDPPDKTWRPQTPVQKYAGYDKTLAQAAIDRRRIDAQTNRATRSQ